MKYEYHFTPYEGWMNDPNGLILSNGIYHMYFQYNPHSPKWDHISWGHETSVDLQNWEMHGTVLTPDEHGMIFSGSAIAVGEMLYYFYTAAEDGHFTQRMAVSRDGGYTLEKNADFEIPTICAENRDPKIFWHEETKAYIICLWLEKNDFAILRSEQIDGKYELTQRFTLPQGYECPNLFCCDGTWFVWTADGYYYPGSFDGYNFLWNGIKHEAYADKIPYAAQIFSGTEDIIMVPWLRTPTVDEKWTGMMGIPRKLCTLRKENDIFLRQLPLIRKGQEIRDGNVTERTLQEDTVLSVEWKE